MIKDGAQMMGNAAAKTLMASFGCWGILCCIIPLLILMFAFLVFTIYSIFKDFTVAMECEESHLWSFVVLTVVLSIVVSVVQNQIPMWDNSQNSQQSTPPVQNNAQNILEAQKIVKNINPYFKMGLIGGLIIAILLGVWGFFDVFIWSPQCTELSESGLWWVGLILFLTNILSIIYQIYAFINLDKVISEVEKLKPASQQNQQPDQQPLKSDPKLQQSNVVENQSQVVTQQSNATNSVNQTQNPDKDLENQNQNKK